MSASRRQSTDIGTDITTIADLRDFHLSSVLDYVASGAYRREPEFQRFLQQRSDQLRQQGENVTIW